MFGLQSDDRPCRCETQFDGDRLVVDDDDCPGGGELAAAPHCRAAVVRALRARDAESVVTRAAGVARHYEDAAAALLVAAGRFTERVAVHDSSLAEHAARDPLEAARTATGRSGPVARTAAESGLATVAAATDGYEGGLRPGVAPTVARERVTARPPPDARLADRYELDSGAVVRLYDRPGDELRSYHLTPVELTFDPGVTATLATAADRLAAGEVEGPRAAGRAVRTIADPATDPVAELTAVLEKHTCGLGALADLFADPDLTDAYVASPADAAPVRVEVDGEPMRTNVRLTTRSAAALASRFRRESGRAFSRADPSLDVAVQTGDRELRVAAVTDPLSDGYGFAFRAHDADGFGLPDLIANDTLSSPAAALLSVAVAREAAVLLAGGRGVGKTTLLGALLPELPAGTRAVVIEDTPELPVDRLRAAGRDVQRLHVDRDGTSVGPAAALRTALRLGEGALLVGEVRGEEAGTLYEAMRVGTGGATLGTVHGDGPAAVRERVVADLEVPESSFADTDLVVTLERGPDGHRRVASIDEVLGRSAVDFATLFDRRGEGLSPTGRIERGNSEVVASLADPAETYAEVRSGLADREASLVDRVRSSTDPVTSSTHGLGSPADCTESSADGTETGTGTPTDRRGAPTDWRGSQE